MIGDPKASTHLDVKLAGLKASLTPHAHYLPTLSSLEFKSSFSPQLGKKKQKESVSSFITLSSSSSSSLPPSSPCLFLTCAGAEADMLLPMYKRNALPSLPQKQQVRVDVRDLRAGTFEARDLGECVEKLRHLIAAQADEEESGHLMCDLLALPSADFTYNSVTHGSDRPDNGASPDNTWHLSFGLTRAHVVLSGEDIAKLLFMHKSWMTVSESHQLSFSPPVLPSPSSSSSSPPSHLRLSLSGLSLSWSVNSQFVSRCLVLEAVQASIGRGEGAGLGLLPFLYGPLDTGRFGGVGGRGDVGSASRSRECGGRLLELLVTTPTSRDEGTGMSLR